MAGDALAPRTVGDAANTLRSLDQALRSAASRPSALVSASEPVAAADDIRWRRRLHARLLDGLDLRRRDVSSMSDAALREEAGHLLAQLIETDPELPPDIDREYCASMCSTRRSAWDRWRACSRTRR